MPLYNFISYLLFLTNTVKFLSAEIHFKIHCESVHERMFSIGSFNCTLTNSKHLTLITAAINSALGTVIHFTGVSLVLVNVRSTFDSYSFDGCRNTKAAY